MQLGKYQLVRKLATGGMAEVYLAKAAGPMGFEKTLVLKRILPHLAEDPAFVEMFLGEAKLAAQLEHPNIVQIFDFGEAEGSYFLAMELIDGPNLRKLVKRAAEVPLPPAICAKLVASAAEGLAYAHDFCDPATGEPLGLIHRDVSPDNILVSRQGAVKVVDFGIAKVAGQGHRTQTGVVKGKVAYMPPEQLQAKPLDLRVDVYALGVVLYELLTGKRPFDATTDVSVMQAILFEQFTPATQRRPDLPPALQQVLDRALTKDREKRYPDCRALQHDLERFVMSTGESVGAYQVARFVSQWVTEGVSAPVGLTPQSVAPPRVQTGPKPATAKSMVAPVESPMDSTSPTTPMPVAMASVVREVAPRSAAERPTVEELAIPGPAGRAANPERPVSGAGQGRASSRSRSDRHAVPGLAVAAEGRASEDSRKAQEAAVMATQPLPALPPGPVVAGSAAKVDADDAVHTRSAELAAPVPVRKGSRMVVAVAVGGALLALGGAVVVFGSGSSGAVPLDVKPLPEQARIVEAVAAPVVAAPPLAVVAAPVPEAAPPVVVAAPVPEVKPSGSGVAESAVAQAGTPAVPEEGKPVTEPAPVPPAAAEATAPNAPASAPVAGPLTEKKPTVPARPRQASRPAAVVAKATLEFRVRPYAVVSLDGKVLGQTPLAAVEVPVGKHTLRLVNKELGKDVTKTVDVKADQPNVFKLNLEAE